MPTIPTASVPTVAALLALLLGAAGPAAAQDIHVIQSSPEDRRSGNKGDIGETTDDDSKKTIYEWTDEEGSTHYTEDPSNVPDEVWPNVRKRTINRGKSRPGEKNFVPSRRSRPAPVEDAENDGEESRNRADWQAEQARLVAAYRNAIDALDRYRHQLNVARETGRIGQQQDALAALKAHHVKAKELEQRLRGLRDEVAEAGGNRAWVDRWEELDLPPVPEIDF